LPGRSSSLLAIWLFNDVKFCCILAKITLITGLCLVPDEEVMKEDAGEIFTLDEVAAYLKVGKRTVYRLAAAKKIPAFKVGGTWRFRRQEIDQWITEQGFYPDSTDTSEKSHNGGEECLCPRERSTAPSSSVKRLS
jgi:excisionase family DNA binding protein